MPKLPDAEVTSKIAELTQRAAKQMKEAEALEELLESKPPDGECLQITIKSERGSARIPIDGATLRGYFAETIVGTARNMLKSGASEDLGRAIRLIPWYLIPKDLREHQDAEDEAVEASKVDKDSCCDNEERSMNGGCVNCGDPCL